MCVLDMNEKSLYQEGIKEYRADNLEKAKDLFHEVIKYDDQFHKAWNALGIVNSKMGLIKDAVICFEHALMIDPGNLTYQKNFEKIQNLSFKQTITENNKDNKTITDDRIIKKKVNDTVVISEDKSQIVKRKSINSKEDSICDVDTNSNTKKICVGCCGIWIFLTIIGVILGAISPELINSNEISTKEKNYIHSISNPINDDQKENSKNHKSDDDKFREAVRWFNQYNVPLLKKLKGEITDNWLERAKSTSNEIISNCNNYIDTINELDTSPELSEKRENFLTGLKIGIEAGKSTIYACNVQSSRNGFFDLATSEEYDDAKEFALNRIEWAIKRVEMAK